MGWWRTQFVRFRGGLGALAWVVLGIVLGSIYTEFLVSPDKWPRRLVVLLVGGVVIAAVLFAAASVGNRHAPRDIPNRELQDSVREIPEVVGRAVTSRLEQFFGPSFAYVAASVGSSVVTDGRTALEEAIRAGLPPPTGSGTLTTRDGKSWTIIVSPTDGRPSEG